MTIPNSDLTTISKLDPSRGTVLVLDDDGLILKLVTVYLENAGYAFRTFSNPNDFFAQTPPEGPACLILDMQMPGMDGPTVQQRLKQLGWRLPIIFISAHATVPVTVQVLKAGAVDFLQKPISEPKLIKVVERTLAIARQWKAEDAELADASERFNELTEREKEVLAWIVSGKLNKQTGAVLGITERTVKAHRAKVMEKLRAESLVDLIRIADKVGLPPPAESF